MAKSKKPAAREQIYAASTLLAKSEIGPKAEQLDDHAFVIIAASMLDEALGEAIGFVLLGGSKSRELLMGWDRPLSTFSARIHMGYALGLFGEKTHRDLNLIREIRNDFAHTIIAEASPQPSKMSFKSQTVAHRCAQLELADHFPELDVARLPDNFNVDSDPSTHPVLPSPKDPRERFMKAARMILILLLHTDPQERPKIQVTKQHLP